MENFIELLGRYTDARIELNKCREEAGYEAGYFCHHHQVVVDCLLIEIKDSFKDAVLEAIGD